MSSGTGPIDRLRRPQYTGENRCTPCTAVNLVVATVLSVAVWVAVPPPAGLALGAAVLVASLGAIYLRGYLVPGTPWFTKTYFPDWLLRAFEKEPAATPSGTTAAASETAGAPPGSAAASPAGAAGGRADGQARGEFDVEAVLFDAGEGPVPERFDVEAALADGGVIEECADVEDLCLTPAFQSAWRERVAEFEDGDLSRLELASVLDVEADRLEVREFGDAFVAHVDGEHAGQWESRAAFLADVAAARELSGRLEGWDDWNVDIRGRVLTGVRLFVETCPDCGGPVTVEEDVVESCCRSIDVAAGSCAECGARLFETALPADA